MESEIVCPKCHSHFFLNRTSGEGQEPQFCTFCGNSLSASTPSNTSATVPGMATIVQGHVPEPASIQFRIGPYEILKSIGKGGMGEVFLAYDTICGRRIALKRIRTDLQQHTYLYDRFLKEARITSQLTHPSIIPIYAIHEENQIIYYTMPFVEGENLKQILRRTRQQEKKGEKLDHIGGSIPSLMRILLNICQAVAYAHSSQVLHRDLKPENIIIGKFGEVLILDWGLAILTTGDRRTAPRIPEQLPSPEQFTNPGKVVGTIAYMSPERAFGAPATFSTDIYAIGVILYQMLCLHLPFRRENLQHFRKIAYSEVFVDPADVAPYREVPKVLTQICQKCLAPHPKDRYHHMEELIRDLESYIEGRAEWFPAAQLDIHNKADWEFQENVLIAEHMAITRNMEISDWVSLMISKASFDENCKIEAKVRIGEKGHGLGFLFSIPEAAERNHLNDGYCLWLGSDTQKSTKLLRSTLEVLNAPDVYLQRHEWHLIRIEKFENKIYLYLNNALQFTYISYLPISGTHLGLLARDADFTIDHFSIYVGSQNVMVNCLAVPDAFLAHKDYAKALSEYRRIGYSFSGRAEGREAMFRAGVTLLEEARNIQDQKERNKYFDLALQEFEKLHGTPGAPLEYLGKALVYESLHDYEEEIKCYTLACRRHSHHPLLHVLKEQIIYRMHECSRYNRLATYNLILLVVRNLSEIAASGTSQKLFTSLRRHWEPLPFIQEESFSSEKWQNNHFAIQIAFWLAKPYFIAEILDDIISEKEISYRVLENALFSLIELGSCELALSKISQFESVKGSDEISAKIFQEVKTALLYPKEESMKISSIPLLFFLIEQAISDENTNFLHQVIKQLGKQNLGEEENQRLNEYQIWAYLLEKNWEQSGKLLHQYPLETLSRETSLLHFLYGCWLMAIEGKEIAMTHFRGVLEVSYPRTWTLAAHFLNGKIGPDSRWMQRAFLWEKRNLYQQLALFFHCSGNPEEALKYRSLEKREYIKAT